MLTSAQVLHESDEGRVLGTSPSVVGVNGSLGCCINNAFWVLDGGKQRNGRREFGTERGVGLSVNGSLYHQRILPQCDLAFRTEKSRERGGWL